MVSIVLDCVFFVCDVRSSCIFIVFQAVIYSLFEKHSSDVSGLLLPPSSWLPLPSWAMQSFGFAPFFPSVVIWRFCTYTPDNGSWNFRFCLVPLAFPRAFLRQHGDNLDARHTYHWTFIILVYSFYLQGWGQLLTLYFYVLSFYELFTLAKSVFFYMQLASPSPSVCFIRCFFSFGTI